MLNALNLLQKVVDIDGESVTILTKADALIYALVGFVVTFLGIVIIIGVIWLAGFIIRKATAKRKAAASMEEQYAASAEGAPDADGISEAERVAIIAAIAAYYKSEETAVSEFKVRRIKRL